MLKNNLEDEHVEPQKRAHDRATEYIRDWWPAYLVVASAITLRLMILFSTSLVPQMDGAYYLAQVRSLLAGKGLRFSDTPLLFWLQAVVVRVLTAAIPLSLDNATIAGVKIVDTIVPPLAALPVFALWLRWTPRERRSVLAAITVAALPAFSLGLVRMTGDLQKNAFALALLSLMIWAFDTGAHGSRIRHWALAMFALLGCALSHAGVLAAALTYVVPAALYRVVRSARRALGFVVFCVGAIVLVYVASLFFPKLGALGSAILSPLALFSGETTFSRLSAGLGPDSLADTTAVVLAYAPLVAVVRLWRGRRPDVPTAATLVGVSVATGILAFPLLGGIDGLRLHLMAYFPAAVLFAWVVGHLRPGTARVICGAMLLVNALTVAPVLPQASLPTIAEESYSELLSLREMIVDPDNTVVVARHGLEWWAAWALDADVIPTIGATPDLWERYDTVLLLQETRVRNGSTRPGPRDDASTTRFVEGTPPVEGANVVFEGDWYRLSRADFALTLGHEYEGEQRTGAAPRPRRPKP
ncbi:MAG: hypothetical protein AB1798_12535 [Spirochaetota bacterium]